MKAAAAQLDVMRTNHFTREEAIVTALIVGAGAVENSWSPVLRALQPIFDFPLTADGAMSFMARLVYLRRWFQPDSDGAETREAALLRQQHSLIKERIANALLAAEQSGEIRPRPELASVLNEFVIGPTRRLVVITTNWDGVVDAAVRTHGGDVLCNGHPLHLHGSIQEPANMYLPAEVIDESQRPRTELAALRGIHVSALCEVQTALRVVVYGLSVSPLDAELGQFLASGLMNPLLRELIVVSPDHALVAHRLKLLIAPASEIRILGYRPDQLREPAEYTVRRGTRASLT